MRESNMRSNVSQDLVGFRTASPLQRVKGGDLKSPPLINQGGVSPQWYNQL